MEEAQTIVSGEQLLDAFQAQDWKILWPILQAHAIHRLRYFYKVKKNKDEIQDWSRLLVQETLDLVFIKKTRNWNINAYPDIKDFLISVIDSHLNNSLRTKPKEAPTADELLFEKIKESTESVLQNITASELRLQIVSELKELGADDDEMLVFECLFDGIEKPEAIRDDLGITDEHFHNIWRRVKRKREKLEVKFARYGY